jgi:hypothetical protein
MEHKDFLKYLELMKEPFALYPGPKSTDQRQNLEFMTRKFTYVDDTPTHVKIQDTVTQKVYDLPLVLIEFVNPGVMRLTRDVTPWNGSFV